MSLIADALASPDTETKIAAATLTAFAADGTCTVDLGGGRTYPGTLRPDGLALATGDTVLVARADASRLVVLMRPADSLPVTTSAALAWVLPWNVNAAPAAPTSGAANPLVVPAVSSGSYRTSDAWTGDKGDRVYQGWWGSSSYQRYGAWFYGPSAFAAIAGQTCTSLTIRTKRLDGGVYGSIQLHFRLHLNATQPAGMPTWVGSAISVAGPAVGGTAEVSLPASWGQALIDGTARGVGLYYTSSADYAILTGVPEDSLTGRLTIGWS